MSGPSAAAPGQAAAPAPGPGHHDRAPHRSGAGWTVVTVVEVGLAVAAVLLDLFLPAVVLSALAGVSLLLRREPASTLGFHRLARPGRQLLQVAGLAVAWTTVVFLLVMPVTEHVTGSVQDTSEFADLEGNLPRLLLFVALSWTLAALVEEFAFRGYLLTRITDLVGSSPVGRTVGVLAVALLFASIHGEQGATGVVLVFVDAVFLGMLRYAYRSVWASVVAHGVSNTIGMVAFYLFGPFSALW